MIFYAASVNPYRGASLFEFFGVLFHRIPHFLSGSLTSRDLVSDELQLLVLVGLSISTALVGAFLVLKRIAMLANALSHTILLGIIIAYMIMHNDLAMGDFSSSFLSVKVLFLASLLAALFTTGITHFLVHVMKMQEDASIGLVFSTLFALGIVGVTVFARDVHIGTEAVMGNIDALEIEDVRLVFGVALANICVFALFFRGLKTVAFDSSFAKTLGWPVETMNYFLMCITAATSIAAFRAVGVLLVLSLFVTPTLLARFFSKNVKNLIYLSSAVSAVLSLIAVALSRHILSVYNAPVSTAGLLVTLLTAAFAVALLFAPGHGVIRRAFVKIKTKA